MMPMSAKKPSKASVPRQSAKIISMPVPRSRYSLGYLIEHVDTDFIGRFLVGPDEAFQLLEMNKDNRPIRQRHVTELANKMRSGEFQGLNGSLIVVDFLGFLIDGQHRLWAIIECGVSQVVELKFGADPKVYNTMNQSKPMTGADMIRHRGLADPTQRQTIASSVIRLDRGDFGGGLDPCDIASAAEAEDQVKMGKAVEMLRRLKKRPLGSPAVLAAVYMRCLDRSVDSADAFFGNLASMEFTGDTDPVKALFTALSSPAARKAGGVTSKSVGIQNRGAKGQKDIAKATALAWNAYREGRKMRVLRIDPEGSIPKLI